MNNTAYIYTLPYTMSQLSDSSLAAINRLKVSPLLLRRYIVSLMYYSVRSVHWVFFVRIGKNGKNSLFVEYRYSFALQSTEHSSCLSFQLEPCFQESNNDATVSGQEQSQS